jgi:hypothetical protein
MDLDQMIDVLQAAKHGEKIECKITDGACWVPHYDDIWDFNTYDYRIAPKPRMPLVEELRAAAQASTSLANRAADRIEELEKSIYNPSVWHTDELLAELKRRMLDRTVKEME